MRACFILPIFCSGLLAVFLSFSTVHEPEGIIWAPGKKISWEDFKGKPNMAKAYYANTNSGIRYEFFYKGDSAYFTVQAVFYTRRSWVKSGTRPGDSLLWHERLHFDITELFARKFRQDLSAGSFTRNSLDDSFHQLRDETMKNLDGYQDQYDNETAHAMNAEKQAEWEKKISREIEALEKFSSWEVRVKLKK